MLSGCMARRQRWPRSRRRLSLTRSWHRWGEVRGTGVGVGWVHAAAGNVWCRQRLASAGRQAAQASGCRWHRRRARRCCTTHRTRPANPGPLTSLVLPLVLPTFFLACRRRQRWRPRCLQRRRRRRARAPPPSRSPPSRPPSLLPPLWKRCVRWLAVKAPFGGCGRLWCLSGCHTPLASRLCGPPPWLSSSQAPPRFPCRASGAAAGGRPAHGAPAQRDQRGRRGSDGRGLSRCGGRAHAAAP